MLAFSIRHGVFHPKGGFELTLCCLFFSLKVLVWPVKYLVIVSVNSCVHRMATVLLHAHGVLSLISVLFLLSRDRTDNGFR